MTRAADVAGAVTWLEPGLRRVRADNASPMTGFGTNSYILGDGDVAVIDPGPADERHLAALLRALRPGERVSHILVTHSHRDHSGLATALARQTGAPVLAYGGSSAGRSARMHALAASGAVPPSPGADRDFAPDRCLEDGATIRGTGWEITALWTPGHMSNHLCFAWSGRVFTGDHVMGWASSVIAPPDGDVAAYMASLDALARQHAAALHPGHGAPIDAPQARIAQLRRHRLGREAQIRRVLVEGPATIDTLTRRLYTTTPAALLPAARGNVHAHLLDLEARGVIRCRATRVGDAIFEPA